MRNILITLSYDGTDFAGWQKGAKNAAGTPLRTVQGELEASLATIHGSATVVNGSGRTDSGVHALAQAANFVSPNDNIPVRNYVTALNSLLPHDIRIHDSREVPPDFHARFSAKNRTYKYFLQSAMPSAHEMRYVWHIRRSPDIATLNDMASVLLGEHDMSSFCASGDMSRSKNRFVKKASFSIVPAQAIYDEKICFEICANAFLWNMVRTITGTLIEAEKKGFDRTYFATVLQKKDRTKAGITAPPQGLFLSEVVF
ncbi:MAG: tRNA pseudouridine(38-40) synthase TruA [Treponemataceae bacterium]|nr:MAG: tRNA pseudouridine(38-40) synthase TruA [Treponemataceae bacterium]